MTTRPRAGGIIKQSPLYVWRRFAGGDWIRRRGVALLAQLGDRLTLLQFPHRKQRQLEAVIYSRREGRRVSRMFGGQTKRLPRDWAFLSERASKPLKIGKRLIIVRSGTARYRKPLTEKLPLLVIPAGAAFGTGEHATTAMSLQLLDCLTRHWNSGWNIVDLGTGTGILVLGARRLGANRGTGIDFDPAAISTATANARLNRIDHVFFRRANIQEARFPTQIDVVTANLFSELLIAIIPKLKTARFLILSGVLREQEREVRRVLRRNRFEPIETRRRGKWIAILARNRRLQRRS